MNRTLAISLQEFRFITSICILESDAWWSYSGPDDTGSWRTFILETAGWHWNDPDFSPFPSYRIAPFQFLKMGTLPSGLKITSLEVQRSRLLPKLSQECRRHNPRYRQVHGSQHTQCSKCRSAHAERCTPPDPGYKNSSSFY